MCLAGVCVLGVPFRWLCVGCALQLAVCWVSLAVGCVLGLLCSSLCAGFALPFVLCRLRFLLGSILGKSFCILFL